MTDILKRENISYRNDINSVKFNKIIPLRKREPSFERKNIKITARTESSKIGNYKMENNINNVNKTPINNFINMSNIIKLNNENINNKNDIKNNKENNITDLNMIIQNKEKAKTFNRQSSNQKIKVTTNINKNKSNQISNNSKNKKEKSQGDIYIKKCINDNLVFLNNDNNKTTIIKNEKIIKSNSKLRKEEQKPNKNNTKRNTDGIIHIGNKEMLLNENLRQIKEKSNKVKAKINKDKDNQSKYFNYTINPQNNELYEAFPENNFKNKILTSSSMKKINTQKPNNNNINNQIESLLKTRKNIDINTEYQINPITNTFSPEKNVIANNLNNTTSKVKLKTNNFITNIEMDKDKEFFQLTENSTILKNKSNVKVKLDNKIEDPEIEVRIIDTKRKDNIIFNNKRIPTKNNKNRNKEIYNNIIFDESNKYNNREIKNNNNTAKSNNVKIKNNQSVNEQINRNSTYNNNESSFFTININNSNIDEINNEPKHNVGNYNFVNNIFSNENINIFNINSQISKSNQNQNNINNTNNNRINSVKVLKSNSNTNKNITNPKFPIFNENKNNNFNSNNNYSNCNTGYTTNNILNQNNNNHIFSNINNKLKKETEIKDVNNKNNKEKENKDEIVLIEFDEEKAPKNTLEALNNSICKNELKKIESLNKKHMEELKEKDISLDKSTSLRVFNVSQEDFIEKDDEVIELLNAEPSRDNIGKIDNNNNHQSNEEDESEIIIQNSEFSIMNEYSKYNYSLNNKNIYQNSHINSNNNNTKNNKIINNNNPNINIDNILMKDTSIISNYGIKGCKSITQAGKERTGHRKKNQDNYIIEKNLNNILGFNLFAILDGHGENGHIVSQLASKYIIKKFTNITKEFNDTESIYNLLKTCDFQNIINIFLEIDNEIIYQNKFDITLSGTTCVLVIQLGEHLICSNIGDSRAILIYEENNKNKIFELSHDSKPDIPEEKKRINLMGGAVEKVVDENGETTGPYRVYIKDMEQPGLAMSRSFGDKKGKSCGVIAYPDIIEFNLNTHDCKYMVICSDGVWEFLSNEEVMEIGNKYYGHNNMNDFCNELLKKSTEMWQNEENYMDDITIVTVFF